MSVLESVFSGRDGLVSVLLEYFGGRGALVLAPDTSSDRPRRVNVAYVPLSGRACERLADSGATGSDRVYIEREFRCVVSSATLPRAPRPGADLFSVGGVDWRVEESTPIQVGDVVVQYELLCKRS